MKPFYVMLTIYSLTLLSVCLFGYYYLFMRPSLDKLEANLEKTSTDVGKLATAVTAIKQTTDRLAAGQSLTGLARPASSSAAGLSAEAIDQTAAQKLTVINRQIDQVLGTSVLAIGGFEPTSIPHDPLLNQVGPTPPTDMALGFVTIESSLWSLVDVYEHPVASSKILGQLKFGNVYPFLSESSDWYQVRISPSLTAWVQKPMVRLSNGL